MRELEKIYSGVVSQFNRYLGHVTKNVAGIYSNSITVEQTDEIAREFVPANIQKRAIAFLNEQLFTTPEWLIDRQLMEKAKNTPSERNLFTSVGCPGTTHQQEHTRQDE
mgnify:FL=1